MVGYPLASVQEMKCFEMADRLEGSVLLAELAEGRGAGHQVVGSDHEVGIGIKVGEGVELGHVLLEEVGLLLAGAERSELGEPDGLVTADLVSLLEVGEESVTILSLGVPVNGAEVDLAATRDGLAGVHERLEPLETLTRVTAVGDGRGTDENLSTVRVHPLGVGGSSLLRSHGSLASMVGLVEAENGLGSSGDGGIAVLLPAAGVDVDVTPEHGNEAVLGVEVVGLRVPVVGPTALAALAAEGLGKLDVVVSHTSLGEAKRALDANSVGAGLATGDVDIVGVVGGSHSGSQSGLGRGDDTEVLGSGNNSDNGSLVVDLLGLVGSSLRSGGGALLASNDDNGLVHGDDILSLNVLVSVTVRVEAKNRLSKSGGGSEDKNLVHHFDCCFLDMLNLGVGIVDIVVSLEVQTSFWND